MAKLLSSCYWSTKSAFGDGTASGASPADGIRTGEIFAYKIHADYFFADSLSDSLRVRTYATTFFNSSSLRSSFA